MGATTGIEWTDATWNPVTGCSHVSEGCRHCYAETLSLRMGWSKKPWTAPNAAENVQLHPERLRKPYSWRAPRMVFVNSMSDMFHPLVPDDFIDDCFAVMSAARDHTFQVLTKRPERALAYMTSTSNGAKRQMHVQSSLNRLKPSGTGIHVRGWPLPNVWLGVSCEDQAAADERIPLLLQTPAAVRFISAEPLLGPIELVKGSGEYVDYLRGRDTRGTMEDAESYDTKYLDWVIVGGESGRHHRPMDLGWLELIVEQCQAAGVPVFVKQDSGQRSGMQGRIPDDLWLKEFPNGS